MKLNPKLERLLFEGIDPIRLDVYGRALTLAFLVYMTYLFTHASEWLTDAGFHLSRSTQLMHAATPWSTMPQWMVPLFALVLYGSCLCLIFGRFTRIAIWVALACAVYVQRVDSLSAFALNKLVIVGFLVIALAPPARPVKRNDGTTVWLQSAWPVRILQATLLIIYVTSAICKSFYGDWLQHNDVVWSVIQGVFRTDLSSALLGILPVWVFTLLQWFVLGFELLAPALLIPRRLRPIGIACGVALHAGLAMMMSTVIFFSLQMVTYYLLFVPSETLHQIRRWYTPARPSSATDTLAQIREITVGSASDADKLKAIEDLL